MRAIGLVVFAFSLLLSALAFVSSGESTAIGETQRSFRDWLALCDHTNPASCSVNAFVQGEGGVYGVDYQLRVSRPSPGKPYEIVLVTVPEMIRADSSLTLQVDSNPPVSLARDKGYDSRGAFNEYVLKDQRLVRDLVPQMKAGVTLHLRYEGSRDKPVHLAFSLMGLTDALAFVDARQAPQATFKAADNAGNN